MILAVAVSGGSMHLGASMLNPFASTYSNAISVANGNAQHGMDIFFKVDSSGNLWFGDWGHDNGGMFGSSTDDMFIGAQQSTITLCT